MQDYRFKSHKRADSNVWDMGSDLELCDARLVFSLYYSINNNNDYDWQEKCLGDKAYTITCRLRSAVRLTNVL